MSASAMPAETDNRNDYGDGYPPLRKDQALSGSCTDDNYGPSHVYKDGD